MNQPKRIENARILIANTPMDTDKIKVFGSKISVESTAKVGLVLCKGLWCYCHCVWCAYSRCRLYIVIRRFVCSPLIPDKVRESDLQNVCVSHHHPIFIFSSLTSVHMINLNHASQPLIRSLQVCYWWVFLLFSPQVAELELAEKEKMKAKVQRILKHDINVFINRCGLFFFSCFAIVI